MKKLFTLCATAAMAFTLSAQADISEGSMFVYTSDATQFVKSADGYDLDLNFGYAVRDNIVLGVGFDQNEGYMEDATTINVSARYFWKGLFFQASVGDATQNLMQLVGTGEYNQVWDGSYNDMWDGTYADVLVAGTADNGANPIYDTDGVTVIGYEDFYVEGTADNGAEQNMVAGTADNGATPTDNMMDGDEIMVDEAIGRSFSAGIGYLMQLDNVFDGGIPSNLYIEPYLGVLSSASEETVSFSTALRIGYRF